MFKIQKQGGYHREVTVINTDTHSSVTVGSRLTTVKEILTEGGYSIPHDIHTGWDFEIDKNTASKIVALTFKISKPIRNQSKKVNNNDTSNSNKDVSVFDLIFG